MRSYMFEVATMLGERIGERFEIDTLEGKFTLDNDGLYNTATQSYRPEVLIDLLTGKLGIKRAPWKPDLDENYYIVDEIGRISEEFWWNECVDLTWYKLGNCYRTAEEAELHRDKWLAFYESDEILEV